jgi:hypothetical protein
MFSFPLGREMMADQANIVDGSLLRATAPGLGLTLTPAIEDKYPFDPGAVYSCNQLTIDSPPDDYWHL